MGNGKQRQETPIIAANLRASNSTLTMTTTTAVPTITTIKCINKNMTQNAHVAASEEQQTANKMLLPHRKVFMITEKSNDDEIPNGTTSVAATAAGIAGSNNHGGSSVNKRKILLIMDEKPQVMEDADTTCGQRKIMKFNNNSENGKRRMLTPTTNGINAAAADGATAPKLLFFANSVDNQLSQKIEEILPEILNRIQAKNGRDTKAINQEKTLQSNLNIVPQQQQQQQQQRVQVQQNGESVSNESVSLRLKKDNSGNNNSNLMLLGAAAAAAAANHHVAEHKRKITLPPKKNLSKLQNQLTTNGIGKSKDNDCANHISNNGGGLEQLTGAATPVIVSAMSLNKAQLNHLHANQQTPSNAAQNIYENGQNVCAESNLDESGRKSPLIVKQQNINLTGDFLFLMKMLPMLEKTPEPRKTRVKMLIEKIMKQCVAGEIINEK